MTAPDRKKVLFIITKSNWGGAQRYVYDLATNLDQTAFAVTVAMGGNGVLKDMLDNAGIKTIPLPTLENSMRIKSALGATQMLYRLFRDESPDIVHLNSSVAGAVGAIAARLARVPRIIFTAHGWAFNEDRSWWQKKCIKLFHYITVLASHRTIAVSTGMAAQMNWPLPKGRMQVVNPGRTIGAMFPRAEAREKMTDFFPSLEKFIADPWLMCIAELHPIKRHEVLFGAIRSLTSIHPRLRLIVIGEGKLHNRLAKLIKSNGMQEHIFLLGSVHEAARFLHAADVFVLASASESYGYVIHEAGLAHVPIVATNVGGITDIITDTEKGLLVPADNVEELAGAIHNTLTDKDDAVRRATALADYLSTRTVKSMAEATAAMYKAL